jgi:hypothetical protein
MTAEPIATAPAPAYRINPHKKPVGHRTRDSTSTEIKRKIGHIAAPIWGAVPGVHPGGMKLAGSQTWMTFAAMETTVPNTNPNHATSQPPVTESLALAVASLDWTGGLESR